jgi:hypothetical protein
MFEILGFFSFWTVVIFALFGLATLGVKAKDWLRDRVRWVKWFSL